MVGSHTLFSNNSLAQNSSDFSFLKHENWFKIKLIYRNTKVSLIKSYYDGYPFNQWENDEYLIVLEGMIYNMTEAGIEESIRKIGVLFCEDGNYNKNLVDFVNKADGDYVIQIYDKQNKKYILFNDYLGRLPIYYYYSQNKVIISKETKFILEFIDEIKFDKMGLFENLMFGYTFGSRTFFQDIKRMNPCEFIMCQETEIGFETKIGRTANFNFKTKNRLWSKKKSLRKLKNQILLSTKNRVEKLHNRKYKIISDLSGGYDSRMVIGALAKYDRDVDYYTYEYIQDESIEASQLFKLLDSPGIHIKTRFKNEIDYSGISELVYKTDGLVNYYTTGICYNDLKFIRKNKQNIAHFSGLGGEFIRHPEKRFFNSIFWGINNNLYTRVAITDLSKLLKLKKHIVKKALSNLFKKNKNNSQEKLKMFYYEYYKNVVGYGGEERARIFEWVVEPLWNKDILNIIIKQLPLRWTGYKYFIKLMELINPVLLKIPIFRSDIDLQSKKSINIYDKKDRRKVGINFKLYNLSKYCCPKIIEIYRKLNYNKLDLSEKKDIESTTIDLFEVYYRKLKQCHTLFDLGSIEKCIIDTGGQYSRLTTLAMYLYEIEKRHLPKIKIEGKVCGEH